MVSKEGVSKVISFKIKHFSESLRFTAEYNMNMTSSLSIFNSSFPGPMAKLSFVCYVWPFVTVVDLRILAFISLLFSKGHWSSTLI